MSNKAMDGNDSDELQALFDSIVQAKDEGQATETVVAAVAAPAPHAPVVEAATERPDTSISEDQASNMFSKIGHLTRKLHDTLHELGYDKALEEAVSTIPDARDRLNYVANLTEQAAERSLNAVDAAMPLQDRIQSSGEILTSRWNKMFDKQLSVEEFRQLVHDTRQHLTDTQQASKETSSQLLEIMMAQDFQDLTGQVIKKIVLMVKDMESQLLSFLVEFTPPGLKHEPNLNLMNGPVINAEGRTDVVTDQQQVDDLLESLGF